VKSKGNIEDMEKTQQLWARNTFHTTNTDDNQR